MRFRAGDCGPESEIGRGGRLQRRSGLIVRDPRSRVSANPLGVCGIHDGDSFRMLVLQMMFLCVNLFMLLQVLGSFEGFLADLRRAIDKREVWLCKWDGETHFANVRLEWSVDWRERERDKWEEGERELDVMNVPRRWLVI